jgi:hypothetical protein
MKDKDLLIRAAQTLREAHPGTTSNAATTRARILTAAAQRKSQGWRRGFFFTPLLAALLAGSAWAAQSGRLSAVWDGVAAVLSRAVDRDTQPPARALPRVPLATAQPEPAPEAAPSAAVPPPSISPATDPAAVAAQRVTPVVEASPASATPKTSRASKLNPSGEMGAQGNSAALPSAVAAAPIAAAPIAAPDPELAVFRVAHDLHFLHSSPIAAIRAYDAYLTRFPSGRFVPEARYNIALNHLKLGDAAAARRELVPFAEGAWGDYRRAEAQQLLDALK